MNKRFPLISSVVVIVLLAAMVGQALAQEPAGEEVATSVPPDEPLPLDGVGSPPLGQMTALTGEAGGEALRVGAEVVARRTAASKHFYLGNGHYQAHLSMTPIHYRDAQGSWQEIDTTLRPQAKGVYAVEANGLQVYLPTRSGTVSVTGQVYPQAPSSSLTLSEEAVPLRPVDVSLSWESVAWRYADAAGHLDDLAAVQQVVGQVEGNTMTYAGVMPQMNESYRVIPNGLKHQLTLLGPPRLPAASLSGEITLDYVAKIELTADLLLYANGAVQGGDFTTDSAIEVRDHEGRLLLLVRAPVAYEAENRQERVRGSYAVWREEGSLRLAWRTPAAWLLDPERHYPVILDPTVEIGSAVADTFITPGFTLPQGDFAELWVGNLELDAFRILLVWNNFYAIPSQALLEDDSSNDGQLRLYQTGFLGDGNSQYVGVYRMANSWLEDEATWTRRTTAMWDTPGGDYYSDVAATKNIDTSTGYKTWTGYGLRDAVALWRTFMLDLYGELPTGGQPPGQYPNGFLLRPTTESGMDIKKFASTENPTPGTEPTLMVNYIDGPLALSNQTPVMRRVPSPDYYITPARSFAWRAVGIRTWPGSANYDLVVSGTPSFYGSGNVDFVVINEMSSLAQYEPIVYSADGSTGYYWIEYVPYTTYWSGIDPGDSHGPYTMYTNSVIRLWAVYESAGSEKCVAFEPASGNARLGIAIFAPDEFSYGRHEAPAQAVATTGGSSVSVSYTASSSGVYGLVVWNEGSSRTTTFYIKGCQQGGVFLPIILKSF